MRFAGLYELVSQILDYPYSRETAALTGDDDHGVVSVDAVPSSLIRHSAFRDDDGSPSVAHCDGGGKFFGFGDRDKNVKW